MAGDKGDPTLEIACLIFRITGECYLRRPLLQLVQDLSICDIAHLMVLFDKPAALITNATLTVWHQSIAGVVSRANIAVDPVPAFVTLTRTISARRSILAVSQGIAKRVRTIVSSKACRTRAFAVVLIASTILSALESLEVAVEAWRATVRSVIEVREAWLRNCIA